MQNIRLIIIIVGAVAAVGTLIFTLQDDSAAVQDVAQDIVAVQNNQDVATLERTVQREQAPSALEIEFDGQIIGTIEGLSLEPASDDPSTLLIQF